MTARPGPGRSVSVGQPAPSFAGSTLAGAALNFPGDFSGRLVLLSFWATWCPNCPAEYPHIAEALRRCGERGLSVVGVALDEGGRERVAEYASRRQITWPVLLEAGPDIAARFGVTAIPAAFLIDAERGVLVAQGDELRGARLLPTIEEEIARRAQPPSAAP